MQLISLAAQVRDMKVSPSFLRKNRKVPAVFYGAGEKSVPLQLDYQPFRKVYMKAGSNQIVELSFDGKKKTVLIQDVQFNPLTDFFSHADFIHVNMKEEITAMIPIELVGVSPAVKDFSGVLTTLKDEIEVRCLPTNLPQTLQIDISGLIQLHSSIHLRDVVAPQNVKILGEPDDVVLTVIPPREEEIEQPKAEAAPVAVASEDGAAAPAAKTEGKAA